jgi:hypothetical protein
MFFEWYRSELICLISLLHLRRVPASEEVKCKNDYRSNKQQMNQTGGNEAAIKPDQPEQQQHHKNCP